MSSGTKPKVIVAGSRNVTDRELVRSEMNQLWSDIGPYEVVSGMARGVDTLAADIATAAGITVHEFPAEWDKYGKKAGPIRNLQMARFADALLAIWDGRSRGTRHMIMAAHKGGLPVRIVRTADYHEEEDV